MSLRLELFVRGIPVPQGGLVRNPHGPGVYHKRRPALEAWRDAIGTDVRAAMGSRPTLDGAVAIRIGFVFARPAGHSGARGLKANAPAHKLTAPDVDKLARAVLDALTGVVYLDDRQVVDLRATKAFGTDPGVALVVEELVA